MYVYMYVCDCVSIASTYLQAIRCCCTYLLTQDEETYKVVKGLSEVRLCGVCEPLLECATGNRNILHVCCEAGNATVEMRLGDTDPMKEGGGRSWSVGW